MKRIISIIVLTFLLVSLIGCTTAEKQMYDDYMTSSKALEKVKSYEADVDIKAYAKVNDEIIKIRMKGDMKQVTHSKDKVDLSMEMKFKVYNDTMEETDDLKMYYIDGVMYQDAMGEKTATKIDLESINQQFPNLDFSDTLSEQYSDYVLSAKSTKVTEGTEIKATIAGSALSDVMETMLLGLDILPSEDIAKIKFSNIDYTYVYGKDNLPVSQSIVFAVTVTEGTENIRMVYNMDYKYTSFNTVKSIPLPADVNKYAKAK